MLIKNEDIFSSKNKCLDKITSICAGLFAVTIWALFPVLAKLVINGANISSFLMLRFLCSTLMLCWIIPKVISKLSLLRFHKICYLIIIIGLNFYLQTYALSQISAGWYVIIFALNPVLTLLILKYKFVPLTWLGLLIALFGLYLFNIEQVNLHMAIKPIVVIFLTGGMLSWSIYVVLIKDVQNIYSDIEIAALTNFFGFCTSLCIWVIGHAKIVGFSIHQLILSILLGLFVPVAYFLFSYGLRKSPNFTINAQYFESIISLLFAKSILHENITILQYFSGMVVLMGVMMAGETVVNKRIR